jgi:hypothetical protein
MKVKLSESEIIVKYHDMKIMFNIYCISHTFIDAMKNGPNLCETFYRPLPKFGDKI